MVLCFVRRKLKSSVEQRKNAREKDLCYSFNETSVMCVCIVYFQFIRLYENVFDNFAASAAAAAVIDVRAATSGDGQSQFNSMCMLLIIQYHKIHMCVFSFSFFCPCSEITFHE